ncbi:hypothetical protein JQ615_07880 [Bradyrhizobium jicamae]|uniref:Uncharacterized protein n=1 Tax=Bradyrhizobium jicamae TaxID=280332 RepID=A0ABS5FET6_9BRAD|nr:hypothetical protein [Bradyrhizobium jicamae]MBR0795303.1 hypothetical protein [Bradyrhizobium jicamae]
MSGFPANFFGLRGRRKARALRIGTKQFRKIRWNGLGGRRLEQAMSVANVATILELSSGQIRVDHPVSNYTCMISLLYPNEKRSNIPTC